MFIEMVSEKIFEEIRNSHATGDDWQQVGEFVIHLYTYIGMLPGHRGQPFKKYVGIPFAIFPLSEHHGIIYPACGRCLYGYGLHRFVARFGLVDEKTIPQPEQFMPEKHYPYSVHNVIGGGDLHRQIKVVFHV
jgi:hypothetical protein